MSEFIYYLAIFCISCTTKSGYKRHPPIIKASALYCNSSSTESLILININLNDLHFFKLLDSCDHWLIVRNLIALNMFCYTT